MLFFRIFEHLTFVFDLLSFYLLSKNFLLNITVQSKGFFYSRSYSILSAFFNDHFLLNRLSKFVEIHAHILLLCTILQEGGIRLIHCNV